MSSNLASCAWPSGGFWPTGPRFKAQMVERSGLAETLVLSMALLEQQLAVKLRLLQALQLLSSSSGECSGCRPRPATSPFTLIHVSLYRDPLLILVTGLGLGHTQPIYRHKSHRLHFCVAIFKRSPWHNTDLPQRWTVTWCWRCRGPGCSAPGCWNQIRRDSCCSAPLKCCGTCWRKAAQKSSAPSSATWTASCV